MDDMTVLSEDEKTQVQKPNVPNWQTVATPSRENFDADLLTRLQCLFECLPAAVLILDNHGKIQECNPAALTLLGAPLVEQLWVDIIEREILPTAGNQCDLRLRNGKIITIATQSLGDTPGQLILLHDVTEEHLLQQRLQHYQRLSTMGKMAASLAHQIRTPLSASLLYAKHLTDPALAEEQRVKFADKLVSRLHNMEGQIREMLAFSKSGRSILVDIPIHDFIEDIKTSLETQLNTAGATLDVCIDMPNHTIKCNPDALSGAIQNCVNNAIEAATEVLNIRIAVKQVDDYSIEFSVEDNGPGISDTLQQKILEPFFTTRTGGTGLGLAVAKTVAETHGGKLWIESEVGTGTAIKFRLPLLEKAQ